MSPHYFTLGVHRSSLHTSISPPKRLMPITSSLPPPPCSLAPVMAWAGRSDGCLRAARRQILASYLFLPTKPKPKPRRGMAVPVLPLSPLPSHRSNYLKPEGRWERKEVAGSGPELDRRIFPSATWLCSRRRMEERGGAGQSKVGGGEQAPSVNSRVTARSRSHLVAPFGMPMPTK